MDNQPYQKPSSGYGRRPVWQWVLIYLIIGGLVYGAVYYFVYAKKGGYNSNTAKTNQPYNTNEMPISNNGTGSVYQAPTNGNNSPSIY